MVDLFGQNIDQLIVQRLLRAPIAILSSHFLKLGYYLGCLALSVCHTRINKKTKAARSFEHAAFNIHMA